MIRRALQLLAWLLPAAILGGLFAWGRFALVEPAEMIAACDAGNATGVCFWRAMIIEVFVHQRVGWLAVAAGLLATVLRWPWLASLAVAAGVVALVLYAAEPGALGLLLGLLVLLRSVFAAPGARASSMASASSNATTENPAD